MMRPLLLGLVLAVASLLAPSALALTPLPAQPTASPATDAAVLVRE